MAFATTSEPGPRLVYRQTDGTLINAGVLVDTAGAAIGVIANPLYATVSGTITADTELPAAAVLADAAANPTTPTVGAANLGYNGATWDRLRSVNTGQAVVTQKDSAGVETLLGIASGDALATATLAHVGGRNHGFNGTTWDRDRNFLGITDAAVPTGMQAAGLVAWDGTNGYRLRLVSTSTLGLRTGLYDANGNLLSLVAATGDGGVNTTVSTMVRGWAYGFNGTSWDRLRTVNTGQLVASLKDSAGVETGLGIATADATATATLMHVGSRGRVFNGTTWDRLRSIAVGDGAASTGIQAAALMAYNSATYDRLICDSSKRLNVSSSDNLCAWTTSFGVTSAVVTSADATTAVSI